MIFKIVTIFLAAIAVLAMFGKLRVPGQGLMNRMRLSKPRKCKSCGRYILGSGPCTCKGGKG